MGQQCGHLTAMRPLHNLLISQYLSLATVDLTIFAPCYCEGVCKLRFASLRLCIIFATNRL